MPEHPVFVKTIVTMDMAARIAADYGVKTVDVLTGFKFIGDQIARLEAEGRENDYILGFEESYGYMTGGHVRDKDAVNGAMIICEMAEYYKKQGKTLIDALNDIFSRFGVYAAKVKGYTFEGTEGMDKMTGIMKKLRENPPKDFGGYKILCCSDYLISKRRDFRSGGQTDILLPTSNVLEYDLENNLKLIVRPSGTEPKIKVYLTIVTNDKAQVETIEQRLISSADLLMK